MHASEVDTACRQAPCRPTPQACLRPPHLRAAAQHAGGGPALAVPLVQALAGGACRGAGGGAGRRQSAAGPRGRGARRRRRRTRSVPMCWGITKHPPAGQDWPGKRPSMQVYWAQLPPLPPHWSHRLRVEPEPEPDQPPEPGRHWKYHWFWRWQLVPAGGRAGGVVGARGSKQAGRRQAQVPEGGGSVQSACRAEGRLTRGAGVVGVGVVRALAVVVAVAAHAAALVPPVEGVLGAAAGGAGAVCGGSRRRSVTSPSLAQ